MVPRYRLPLGPFDELRREMDRLFEGYGQTFGRLPFMSAPAYPPLSIWDDGDALAVEAEVPGVKQDDLEILAMGNELTIKGRRTAEHSEKRAVHRQERTVGEFTRAVTLPVDVDADRIEASLQDGVLSIRLPKAESAKPRRIELKAR